MSLLSLVQFDPKRIIPVDCQIDFYFVRIRDDGMESFDYFFLTFVSAVRNRAKYALHFLVCTKLVVSLFFDL